MGSPKHALRLPDGRLMIEAVAETLAAVCERIVVVGPPDALQEAHHIEDARPGLGPLGGIEALLASGRDTQYLVSPCDVPLITASLLRRLTVPTDALVTLFLIDGQRQAQPLPARISAEALPQVRRMLDRGDCAVHRLIESIEPEVVRLSVSEAKHLTNINTPGDYARL